MGAESTLSRSSPYLGGPQNFVSFVDRAVKCLLLRKIGSIPLTQFASAHRLRLLGSIGDLI